MWVVYCVNLKQQNPVEILCYTESYTSTMDAIDDYAIVRLRFLEPEYPKDRNPLDREEIYELKYAIQNNYKYYLCLDPTSANQYGDAERILLKMRKKDTEEFETYISFTFSRVDRYIDEFLEEETPAVRELKGDMKDQSMYMDPPEEKEDKV